MKRGSIGLLLVAAALSGSPTAFADGESNESLFAEAVASLGRGTYDDAIDRFELLADRGFSHPDASYDRAVAYVRRASSHSARAGDLGRAAAALGEALVLRPEDADAKIALERVRQEIVRRRARAGASQVELRVSLGWAVVGLLDEETWAVIAAVGSAIASVGLALRWFTRAPAARLSGVVAASLGALALVITGSLAALARHERRTFQPAVVVVEEARLFDENGAPITGPGSVVPEGAAVRVMDRRGTLAHVEWGTLDGWLSLGQLRVLRGE